jgi:hypothetical protein
MNKRTVLASLNKIANELDNNNLFKEASFLTNVMKRVAQNDPIFDPRQKQFPIDTMTAMGPARVDLSGYQQTEEELPRWLKEQIEREKNPPKQKDFPLDTYRAMGPARGGNYDFNNKPNLPNFPDEEDELPRWLKEQIEREKNPPKPRVLHPSEIQSNQKVDEIFPDFMENYEKLFDDNPDFDFGTTDPRVLHEISIEFLHDEANDPNKYLQNKINKMEEKYQNWFEQNFNFTIDHMRFIRYFMDSNNLNISQMESLLRKVYK